MIIIEPLCYLIYRLPSIQTIEGFHCICPSSVNENECSHNSLIMEDGVVIVE